MSEDVTLDEFVNKDGNTSNEPEKPELIQGVAWSQIDSVPDDWTVNNVESDIEILTGNNFSSDYFTDEDGIPLIRIRDLAEDDTTVYYDGDYDSKYLISQQDLLVGMDGEFEPHLWTGPQALLNQRVCKIEPNERYNKIFFRYAIEKPLFYIQKSIAGTTVKHLSQSNINDLNLPTPSLEEQRKIAAVLYNVDQAIQKTEEIIEQTHKFKKALMQDVFHGRHENFEGYQSTPVGEIPPHWSVASIGDVVHTAQYGISESMSEEGQYPIFRMNNLENGYVVDKPLKYIDLNDEEFEKYRVKQGDILFNRTNSLELVGKTGIYELKGDHVFASYLVRLQTNDKADSYYLNYYMNSSEAQNRMRDFATKGVSQANINANSIQQVKLPLPPLEEQKEIVDQISGIDSQIEVNQQYKSQLKRFKYGLMQDLLSGTVRTTDTNIEVPDEIAQHG